MVAPAARTTCHRGAPEKRATGERYSALKIVGENAPHGKMQTPHSNSRWARPGTSAWEVLQSDRVKSCDFTRQRGHFRLMVKLRIIPAAWSINCVFCFAGAKSSHGPQSTVD